MGRYGQSLATGAFERLRAQQRDKPPGSLAPFAAGSHCGVIGGHSVNRLQLQEAVQTVVCSADCDVIVLVTGAPSGLTAFIGASFQGGVAWRISR